MYRNNLQSSQIFAAEGWSVCVCVCGGGGGGGGRERMVGFSMGFQPAKIPHPSLLAPTPNILIIIIIKTLFQEGHTISTKLISLAALKYIQLYTNIHGKCAHSEPSCAYAHSMPIPPRFFILLCYVMSSVESIQTF